MIAHIGGAAIGFDDTGTGTPIVFLHAFPLDRTMWAPQLARLSGQARCIAVDLRGFGESSATPPFSVDRYADDVAGVLDTLGVDRAIVAGLSLGGYVAFALWRRHRARVRALVLADTRAGADTADGRERRRALIEVARANGSDAVAARQLEVVIGPGTRERHPEIRDRIRRIMAASPVAGIVGALEAMLGRPDSTSTLSTIDVPTLFVVGEEDTVTPLADAQAMQHAIPGSRVEVVAGAGHLSNLEQPDAFTGVVEDFLGTLLHGGRSGV